MSRRHWATGVFEAQKDAAPRSRPNGLPWLTAGALLMAGLATAPAWGQTKLLRFPDVAGDRVAFCYGGDIWTAPVQGGTAARITAHPGQELFPKFSPDGKWIAFTGQYDGDEQVYVVPAEGGVPRQLTFYPARGPLVPRRGSDNQVYGWTPDGKRILFRSYQDADGVRTLTALYTVSLDGGLPTALPMPTSGAGDFSPDGKRIVYSPLFRDFRTWKRYQGGWAQDLFIFNLQTSAAQKIAASPRTERDPMWIGDSIYFVSDRDGTLNLYVWDLARQTTEKLTQSATWDVRWASSDHRRRIVYELNGELHVFDVASRKDAPIAINVPSDGLASRPARVSAEKQIESFSLSPKGERALFVARGDVFTVPIQYGPTRNLTRSSNAHDKHAAWSPDGRKIAYVSDASGEEQIYLVDQDGTGKPEALTRDLQAFLFAPEWAPDGKRLAFSDQRGKLRVLTVADKALVEVADAPYGLIRDYAWSPDGAWLAWSMADRNGVDVLHIWGVADGKVHRVTDGVFSAARPAWDPEGQYLYFLSDRQFAPQISSVEWNFAGNRTTGIFALTLRPDVKTPFPPRSDEVGQGDDKNGKPGDKKDAEGADASEAKKKTEDKVDKKPVKIDFDGLAARAVRVPLEADNIADLAVVKGFLLYRTEDAPFYGRDGEKAKLRIFDLKEREASVLADDAQRFSVSGDGAKVLVREGKKYALYDAKPKAKDPKTVSTKELMVDRVPAQEWATAFGEVWRRYRDFFYVRNMHGYDWKAIGDRYRTLLSYVAHRSDLTYLLGEMVAELNVGHAYIEGGDFELPERAKVGLPGARFALDEKSGRYRIARILRGQNEEEKYRAPLAEVGVDAHEGDFVLAIDGDELTGSASPYRLLRDKTHPITLTLNDRPTLEGARKVTYTPIFDESPLLYFNFVSESRERVARLSDGKVGYLHIPDMGAPGIYEFIKWYYPQIRKQGLIVDVRSNGGGNVSQWIIERLGRKLLGTRFGFRSDEPGTYPTEVFYGHLACLISETSASDGDIFPHRFRKAGLGPLIGKRTWGGVVGISSFGPLIDGGTVLVPLQATNDVDGSYIIEGRGVDPDLEVENDPASVIAGKDPQLERGVEDVLRRIAEKPMTLPKRPPDPVKTK